MELNANVNEPQHAKRRFIVGVNSNRRANRKMRKTPATTNVDEWINADAGVGASIASGSQT